MTAQIPFTHLSPLAFLHDELARLSPVRFMVWNSVLAVIPALLALAFFRPRPTGPKAGLIVFWAEMGLVLLFLPNAPYVATDLVHFLEAVRGSSASPWKILATQFPLYVGFVLFGLVCYAFTEDRMLEMLAARHGRKGYLGGLWLIPLLSAVGIYLGRADRFNSWDVLAQPMAIAQVGTQGIGRAKTLGIVVGMAGLLVLVHQGYRVFRDGIRYRREGRPVIGDQ
ncbi:MAG TPA: DUF1361 domain-containing protein [Gemmatimonadaceae bacterium]|nr:DUF1361 domain-containing protein [Gemmatimonadaceae bacterium]